jgi:hypothetical protein
MEIHLLSSALYTEDCGVRLNTVFCKRQLNVAITNSVEQEPEGSSPHSQQPATGPCPEPVKSNPHPSSQSP